MTRAGFTVEIDFEACKGCLYCLELCPQSVFEPGERLNAKGFRPPAAARIEDCVGCQGCFFACPDFCLSLEPISGGQGGGERP
jgi:2-oxoglutarate ferredoxin oxidoreductase subunit delta